MQLYYGSEQGAYSLKDKFNALYPDIPAKLTFSTPDWKIQVGNYYTKLQADHDIVQLKIDFPGAIVIAADIDIAEN
ncbi:MAG: SPOR domain-containing protein [Flavobacteriaceae bacterium]|nr:SPOR domain-containing protein [Flavobacteriaceae bacterium]